MKLTFEQTQRRNEEEKESEERKHTEEVTFLKKTNAQLKVATRTNSDFVKFIISLTFSVSIGGNYCAKKIKEFALSLNFN